MVDPSIFTSDERLRRVKDLVQRGLDRPLHLSDGAAEVGLELKYFSKDFQARAGVSFRQWRSQERLNEARSLLARQDLTIWQVAERVGLSESSFRRLIKASTGLSPTAYRRSLRTQLSSTPPVEQPSTKEFAPLDFASSKLFLLIDALELGGGARPSRRLIEKHEN
jgi:AraC-like DNA-binding protein